MLGERHLSSQAFRRHWPPFGRTTRRSTIHGQTISNRQSQVWLKSLRSHFWCRPSSCIRLSRGTRQICNRRVPGTPERQLGKPIHAPDQLCYLKEIRRLRAQWRWRGRQWPQALTDTDTGSSDRAWARFQLRWHDGADRGHRSESGNLSSTLTCTCVQSLSAWWLRKFDVFLNFGFGHHDWHQTQTMAHRSKPLIKFRHWLTPWQKN